MELTAPMLYVSLKDASRLMALTRSWHKSKGPSMAMLKIFSSKILHENLAKINGEFKENDLVKEVIDFIAKDKKRPICTPLTK